MTHHHNSFPSSLICIEKSTLPWFEQVRESFSVVCTRDSLVDETPEKTRTLRGQRSVGQLLRSINFFFWCEEITDDRIFFVEYLCFQFGRQGLFGNVYFYPFSYICKRKLLTCFYFSNGYIVKTSVETRSFFFFRAN